jgi:carbamoyltransferase
MIVLGIGDSHEAHACVVKDGVLVAAMAEERLSRRKAEMGYPQRSIDAVLSISGLAARDIDLVAFAGQSGYLFQTLYKCNASLSIQDWVKQCNEYWKPLLLEGKDRSPFDDLELFLDKVPDIRNDPYYPFLERARNSDPSDWDSIGQSVRMTAINSHLGIDASKIEFFRHEDCHKIYGYHSVQQQIDDALILTIEGGGDDSSATVSTIQNGELTEHWRSNDVMLGRLYRYVTLILGMLPSQHEYKVMGLAPYGTEYHGRRSLDFFRKVNCVVGGEIHNIGELPDLYFSVKEGLEGERFDGIAWGLQTYLEETLCEWVRNNIQIHGISDIILSGGVAQNIKAVKALADMPEVSSIWSGPISGDGSLGIGAAWCALRKHGFQDKIEGLDTVYLGTDGSENDIDEAIEEAKLGDNFEIIRQPSLDLVAGWIEGGKIVARYSGHMEFGQRALGNRSILADPRRFESVERINQKVKYRDFWMPFTPSMMIEEAQRLLLNPKSIYSPFMTMAFDLKPEHRDVLSGVVHPADKTARPQMLRREDNPRYYDLLAAFKQRTGLGVLLNTSFNLHGDAIVESPKDAVDTFLRSEIDVLLFDNVAIKRR